ncbi:MAG TPA: hypothetical protein VKX25_05710 [Bryobacteraceae bacterium]|jgi:hypothetical protein|nr:hypothetical protein [Bryobacteraceae bacterium]
MKLRFRANSLRLRVNRREVEALAAGQVLRECVRFPGSELIYSLEPVNETEPRATFEKNTIRILAPAAEVERWWSATDAVGLYFDLDTGREPLRLMIEKDLECVDGPPEERDPHAFPRSAKSC